MGAEVGRRQAATRRHCRLRASRRLVLYTYSSAARSTGAGLRTCTILAIRLPEEIEARLAALAKRTGRSKTFYARRAILEHLEHFENLYLAEERWLALQRGESETVSVADLEAELGLGDRV